MARSFRSQSWANRVNAHTLFHPCLSADRQGWLHDENLVPEEECGLRTKPLGDRPVGIR